MFITFEGVDGCGKSTIANEVFKLLKDENKEVILTREPGGVKIAEDIRKILLNKEYTSLDERTETLLFAASRRQHLVEKVWPALNKGKIVICDRYIDSSLAYQGAGHKVGIKEVFNVNMFATENTLPDLTILFDIDPREALKRINQNKDREVNRLDLETLNFYDVVRKTYLDLANEFKERYYVIDASKPIDEVIKETYKIIKEKLNERI